MVWGDGSHVAEGWEFAQSAVKDGKEYSISCAAAEMLDLTDAERNALFYIADDLDDLEAMVKNIANGDPVCDGIEDED